MFHGLRQTAEGRSCELTLGPGGPTRPAAPGKPVAPWERQRKLGNAKISNQMSCGGIKRNQNITYRRSLSPASTFRSRNTCRTLEKSRYYTWLSAIYFTNNNVEWVRLRQLVLVHPEVTDLIWIFRMLYYVVFFTHLWTDDYINLYLAVHRFWENVNLAVRISYYRIQQFTHCSFNN